MGSRLRRSVLFAEGYRDRVIADGRGWEGIAGFDWDEREAGRVRRDGAEMSGREVRTRRKVQGGRWGGSKWRTCRKGGCRTGACGPAGDKGVDGAAPESVANEGAGSLRSGRAESTRECNERRDTHKFKK